MEGDRVLKNDRRLSAVDGKCPTLLDVTDGVSRVAACMQCNR